MRLTSTAFADGDEIPMKYTHDGKDVSPPLAWTDVPNDAQSLALIVDDPDVPNGSFTHWVVVDLPPSAPGLPEAVTKLPAGRFGLNGWNHAAWNGPSPPRGRHHYVFRLLALDRELGLARPTKQELEVAIAGHVIDETTLTATYQRVVRIA
jgi:Raf kinase inhibitor-like YbhB/YbcL family protein